MSRNIRMTTGRIAAIASLMLVTANAAEPKRETDQELIDSVKCPESYTDRRAYIEDLAKFLGDAKKNHPEWTNEQLIAFRYKALQAHKCAAGMR